MSTEKTEKRTATAESTEKEIEDGCPECGGDLLEEGTELYCDDCGLVTDEDTIDHGPEWRAYSFAEENEKSRTGAPVTNTMHDRGLSTKVGGASDQVNAKTQRLRKWQKRAVMGRGKERGLHHMLTEIWRLVSELGLPEYVKEGASNITRKASKDDLIEGRSFETIAAGSVLLSSRISGDPVSLTEIMDLVNLDGDDAKKRVHRTYKKLNRELELEVPPPDPRDSINPFLQNLRLKIDYNDDYREFKQCVVNVVDEAKEANLHSGCDPRSIAAGAVYLVAKKRDLTGHTITQREVANAYDLSDITVRNRYQEIEEVRDIE